MYFILNFRFDKIQQIKTKANKLDIRWELKIATACKIFEEIFRKCKYGKSIIQNGHFEFKSGTG